MVGRTLLPILVAGLIVAGAAGASPSAPSTGPTEGRSNFAALWSPDSTWLAFVADATGPNDHDLWLVRADGSEFLDLTPDDLNEGSASWSPDGQWLAFTSAPIASPRPSVEVVGVDGANRRVLASGSKPAWAPDGRRIAYIADDGVHVINADGTGDRFVARTDDAAVGNAHWSTVSWSPDSTQLAYIRGSNVFAVNADGSNPRQLTNFVVSPALRIAAAPAWAPDGATIAFVVVGPATAPQPQEIWDVRPDGTALTRLASYGFVDSGANWTPDGRAIVYAAAKDRDGDVDIYRVGASGGAPIDVTNDLVWNEDPTEAPDGRNLAFDVRYGAGFSSSDIWTLDLQTGTRRNLTGSAPGLTVDANAVKPPNKLMLRPVRASIDRSFRKPILRLEIHVQDARGDDVKNAVVKVNLVKPRSGAFLAFKVPRTDVHGQTQWGARALNARVLHHGTRLTLVITVHPMGSYSRSVVASKRLVVRV